MPIITWNNELFINIKEIDEQHIKLVDLMNQLFEAVRLGKSKEVLGQVLVELFDYTNYHFGAEELLMEQFNYSETVHHKEQHKNFINSVSEYKKKYDIGLYTISLEVIHFLRDWLTNHIMTTDKKLGLELNKLSYRGETPRHESCLLD